MIQYKRPLWKHQEEAIERAKSQNSFGLFMDMGVGKTATAIHILRWKYLYADRILKTLVFCPRIVLDNWAHEFKLNSNIPQHEIKILTGSAKKRLELLKNSPAKIFVLNYESLNMDELFQELILWQPEAIVIDEAHRVKNPKAKRSKKLYELANPKNRQLVKLALTGTPAPNSLLDLFMIYKIFNPAIFGLNYYFYQKRFFEDKNAWMPKHRWFPNWVARPGAEVELNKIILSTAALAKKKDCLDLPELIKVKVQAELSAEQRKHYEEMRREFITYVKKNDSTQGAVVANLAITKGLRLMQILSGFVNTVSGDTIPFKENPRLEVLKELLEQITPSHKVIVWAVWHEDFKQIAKLCDSMKLKYVEGHGLIDGKTQRDNLLKFDKDQSIRVFIGSPAAMGVGCNITAASYAIFYSRNFSYEQSTQAESRNWRGGSEIHEKITRIDIVAKDTLDEKIMEALERKEKISDAILLGALDG